MKSFKFLSIFFFFVVFIINGLPGNTVMNPKISKTVQIIGKTFLFLCNNGPKEVFTLSLYNSKNQFKELDKFAHFTIYFILAVLFFKGFPPNYRHLTIIFFYGFVDELHQIPISNRTFSLFDLLFDFLGIIFVYYLLYEKHKD